MGLTEQIRKLMEEKGVTQKSLAKEIHITEAALSRYLSGERTPRIDVLVNLARFFDVSLEYLVGEEDKENMSFGQIKKIIARNANEMTDEQKLELMRIISKR